MLCFLMVFEDLYDSQRIVDYRSVEGAGSVEKKLQEFIDIGLIGLVPGTFHENFQSGECRALFSVSREIYLDYRRRRADETVDVRTPRAMKFTNPDNVAFTWKKLFALFSQES